MDKTYDFNWMTSEIDNSIVFGLIKDGKVVSTYQVSYLLTGEMNQIEVKFANIDDLEKFINFAVVRFYDIANQYNIIDIPLRELKKLYDNSNDWDNNKNKRIKLSDLDCFSVIEGKRNNKEYLIEVVKIQEVSEEFMMILKICSDYGKRGMSEKYDALYEVNSTNYRVERSLENNGINK